ncbi:MAG: HAD-IB family phosphatase [Ruminococcus sp.]|nr:HAD-IB family phosphatase [Ruminococcus sp.]
MNVYDFDGTIYKGDSTVDFYLFMLKRHPGMVRFFPAACTAAVKHKLGKCSTKEWKEIFFRFLSSVPDVQNDVQLFWKKNLRKIMPWYTAQKQDTDVVISASPSFLLEIPAKELGIQKLIASEVDMKTGKFSSENCKGKEKVKRFREIYPDETVSGFYSDSLSDLPMAELAEKAFLCRKGHLTEWDVRKG